MNGRARFSQVIRGWDNHASREKNVKTEMVIEINFGIES